MLEKEKDRNIQRLADLFLENNTKANNPKNKYTQDFARILIPLKPCNKEYVYTIHVTIKITIVTTVRFSCT